VSYRIDSVDAQIVELLQQDGRIMYKDIADKVGVSLPTVRARLRNLIKLGLIKKFTVVVDLEKIMGRIRAFVLADSDAQVSDEFREKLGRVEEIRAAFFVAGNKRVLLDVDVEDMEHLNSLMFKLSRELGFSGFSVYVSTKVLKEEYGSRVKPDTPLQFRCRFCDCIIYGKPLIRYYYGGKYYFSGEECASAFKERLDQRYGAKKGQAGTLNTTEAKEANTPDVLK
jgi:Lrp/AsnC family leucine-responsive transcriptional regulator